MVDNKLTDAIRSWLEREESEQSISEGAELLLRLNRNRILYQSIIRRQLRDKLVYELKKHLDIRLAGYTLQQVGELDKDVKQLGESTKGFTYEKGKRSDHDELPEQIRQMFEAAHIKMVEMRHLHEKLKLMEADEPCDRFPFLKSLMTLHEEYRSLYNKYDEYRDGDPIEEETPADIAKKIGSYRNYLSVTRDKLRNELQKSESSPDVALYRSRLQERYNYLVNHDVQVGDEIREDLASLGIDV